LLNLLHHSAGGISTAYLAFGLVLQVLPSSVGKSLSSETTNCQRALVLAPILEKSSPRYDLAELISQHLPRKYFKWILYAEIGILHMLALPGTISADHPA